MSNAIHTQDGRTWAGDYARGGLIPRRGNTRDGRYAYVVRDDGTVLYTSTRATRSYTHRIGGTDLRLVWPTRYVTFASPVRVRVDRSVITRTAQENNARAHVQCM